MYRATTKSLQSSPVQAELQPQEGLTRVITLTAREKEIVNWGLAGKSSWEIAQICGCTEAGVNYHFCNIRRKFGVRSRWVAMVRALEQGLIESP
jgi:DNA-binding CsgD family transcriptional regulator